MNQDGYVRLRPEGPLLGNEPSGPTPILFVDVEPGTPPQSLRQVPHSYLATVRAVIVRGSVDDLDGIKGILAAIECKVPCFELRHDIGSPATLLTSDAEHAEVRGNEFVPRARTAELLSLLHVGEAVWEPRNFHFLLPSGRHARAFVRPGNAIRSLRDAHVVALWLLAHVHRSGSGVVVDTNTLTAVLLALQSEARSRGVEIGPIRVLDGYPATWVETSNTVHAVTEEVPNVLGLLSVNATGTVQDLIVGAVRDLPHVERGDVVSLVDLNVRPASRETDRIRVTSLLDLGDPRHPKQFESYDGACALCDRPETAPLVPVDIDTFDVRFPSFVEREMPSLRDPGRNRSLWEACHRKTALRFEADPDEPVRVWRGSGKMTWKVDWDTLLTDSTFATRTRVRLEEEIRDLKKDQKAKGRDVDHWEGFDLVLMPERDTLQTGFHDFWDAIHKPFCDVNPRSYPDRGEWPTDILDAVKSAKRILVVSLGTVTGTTLQRALNEVQRTRQDVDYVLHGIVIHARPARRRTWEVLLNSYAYRLIAAYLSHVPDDSSPLREELRYLKVDSNGLSKEALEFLVHRQAVCKGESGLVGHGFLWGANRDEHISPHSIFGELLNIESTFIATGSAIHARREAVRRPPNRILFEMPAIARSYYDPVIFSCMLRWLQRQEMWWGDTLAQAESVLGEVLARASDNQRPLLLGELLLASAQGKIPARGIDRVVAQADALANASTCTLQARGMLELGVRLLRSSQEEG